MTSALERISWKEGTEGSSFWDLKGNDPRVDSWLLMRNPVPVLLIMVAYILLIAIGPKVMKNRPPFKLDKLLLFYNSVNVLVSGLLAYKIMAFGTFKNGFLLGGCHHPMNTKDEEILFGTWIYFINKVVELLDTVFFVLRKKNNQITLLHVYHHSTMVLYMWSYLKFAPGGDGTVLAFLNCCVHTVMYSYYLLAGLGPKFQKFLWWKKYVTEMQLIQFILMLVYLIHTHFSPKCHFSNFFNGFIFTNIFIYMILFLDFYIKSYKKNKDKTV